MARRIVSITTITPSAFADTVNMTDAQYPFTLQGGASTQINYIHEISISGQATSSSSPTFMILSRDSQVGSGSNTYGTGEMDAALDPQTAALTAAVATGNSWATNKPQRSSTGHLLNCSLNAFGGVYFWRANKLDECVRVFGSSTAFPTWLGEVSLSAFTGGTPGAIGAHMIYESV